MLPENHAADERVSFGDANGDESLMLRPALSRIRLLISRQRVENGEAQAPGGQFPDRCRDDRATDEARDWKRMVFCVLAPPRVKARFGSKKKGIADVQEVTVMEEHGIRPERNARR